MTDPFTQLRRGPDRAAPDPGFAAALRARIQRALLAQPIPERNTQRNTQPNTQPTGGPPTMSQLTPYLAVRDARAAIDWYADAFGAQVIGDPYVTDDGRIGHAELEVAGAALYLSDAFPEMGISGPEPGQASVTLHLSVPDVDAAVERAAAVGATVTRQPDDAPYGRTGVVVDPYGHRWMLQKPAPAPAAPRHPLRSGEAVYLTLQVPDGARARDFYEAVLGWSMQPGRVPDGWEAASLVPMVGIGGGATETGMVPMYAVDDIEVAVMAVGAAGGEAGEIEQQSYGLSALCRDDQGLPFYLGQMA
jgi:uncharacterized glyoxalase superfamily protein PhnB